MPGLDLTLVSVCVHQVVLTISQMMWCLDMDSCLEGDHDHFAALQKFEYTNFDVNHASYSLACFSSLIFQLKHVFMSVFESCLFSHLCPEAECSGGTGTRRASLLTS